MKKILVIGIICLFVGVGIHPAFALDTNTPSSENVKPTKTDRGILENTNCFVMGFSDDTTIWPYNSSEKGPYLFGDICFGHTYLTIWGELLSISARGFIQTINETVQWTINKGNYFGFVKIHLVSPLWDK